MRSVLAMAGITLLAACAASPPPPTTYISGPIVPDDEQVMARAHSGGRNLMAPAPAVPPEIIDDLNDIERQLRALRDQLPSSPGAAEQR
jgi:hypothetical protein